MSRITWSAGVGSVGRSFDRDGVGAGSRMRIPASRRHPPAGIFDANFGIALTADYADAVDGGSHPKAEPRVGRAGVIVPRPPRRKVKAWSLFPAAAARRAPPLRTDASRLASKSRPTTKNPARATTKHPAARHATDNRYGIDHAL